jgi:hypothetical protein
MLYREEAPFVPDECLPMIGNSCWSLSTWAGLVCAPMLFAGVGEWMAAVDAASFNAMLLNPYFLAALVMHA